MILGIVTFLFQIQFPITNIEISLFLVIALGIILSDYFYIPKPPKGNLLFLSMDTALYIATLFIFGLETTLLTLLVCTIIFSAIRRKVQWWKHIFNFSIYTMMITCTYNIYVKLGGAINGVILDHSFPFLVSLLSYFIVNMVLLIPYFYLASKKQFITVIKSFLNDTLLIYFITLAGSYILITLLQHEHPIFGVFIFTFIIILLSITFRNNFRLYEKISKDKIHREQILDSLPVGVITIDHQTSSIDLNTSAAKLLNLNSNQVMEFLISNPELNHEFWKNVGTRETYQNNKVYYTVGEVKHLLLMSQTKLIDQYEQLIGRIIYFIDITDTDELEKRIYQSEKLALLGQLAAGAAHEIRNPLTVIQGFVSLMNVSLKDHERDKFQLPLLLKEFKRIDTIIDDMLLIAKPGAPIIKEVCLESLVKEILPLFDSSVTNQDIRFSVNMTKAKLMVDPKQMTQVFYNLFRNSSEAIGEKGWIKIYSDVIDGMYQLFIKDNGPGIPKELQKTIFDPFQTTKDNGTGLGLTIVQRIIENHGGKIELQSNEMGTTFMISLPIKE